jgi:nickel-dependent lactate racemase
MERAMLVGLAYGKTGLSVELPEERTTVVEPAYLPGIPDERGALLMALRNPIGTPPLRRMVRRGQTVAISVCDVTRPMPSATVLPALLGELCHLPREQIVVLVATGTHRADTPEELEATLGPEVVGGYRVVSHNAFVPGGLKQAGETPGGIPIWLNRHWLESDVRITTGFVEPHFFAGFSGGPKMVAPGLAGFETIMALHSASMIGHPSSTWGVTEGNPVHDAIRQIASQTGVHFSVDVTINREHRITSAYAGELFAVHRAATQVARRTAMHPVPEPFDVVLTTNSGYPLDLNLYQSVKGMSAAAQIVRDGGAIVCVAECRDGIPDNGEYRQILASRDSPAELLRMIGSPGYNRQDQWQVQIQAQILGRARVFLKSGFLTPGQVRAAHLEPVEDISSTVSRLLREYGTDARVCVLPQGPQTIPYVDRAPGREYYPHVRSE